MGRYDTTSNAQLLLGGFDRGVNLSQNGLQGLLQTAHFINSVQQGKDAMAQRQQELDLRKQAHDMMRQQYATELQDKFDQKQADTVITGWLDQWDGASPPPPELGQYALKASKDLRGTVFNARGVANRRQQVQSQLVAARKSGTIQSQAKLRDEAESLGIDLDPYDFPPTEQAKREDQAKQEMQFVVRDAVEAGILDPKRGERFVQDAKSDNDVKYVHGLLKQQADAAKAQQEMTQQQQYEQAAVGAAGSVGLDPAQVQGSLAMRRAGIPFTPQAPEKMDPRAFARAGISDRKLALDALEAQWKPYINPMTGGPAKGAGDAAGVDTGWAWFDGKPTPEYVAAQQAFAQWRQMQSEQAGAATGLVSGAAQPQPSGGQQSAMPPDLIQKAKAMRQRGMTPDQIKASLEADGWRFE